MLKSLSFLSLFALIACGGDPAEDQTPQNQNIRINNFLNSEDNPEFSDNEKNIVNELCAQLRYKKERMNTIYAGTNKRFYYEGIKQGCNRSQLNFNYETTVRVSGTSYAFNVFGSNFGFKDMLLNDSSIISQYCFNNSNQRHYVFGNSLSSMFVEKVGNGYNAKFILADRSSGDSFKIVKLDNYLINKDGLVLERTNSNSLVCGSGADQTFSKLLRVDP